MMKYRRKAGGMTTHRLKTLSEYYEQVERGTKRFEIRLNDRDFRIGDILELAEIEPDGYYTQRKYSVVITYITDFPPGLKDGYVCMSIEPCSVIFIVNGN